MKRMAVGFLVLAALVTLIATPAMSAEVRQYKFGGGTSGGPWFVGVGAAVPVLNQNAQGKFSITYGASAGSVENVRRAATYEYDTGFAHVTTLYEALTATGSFKGRKVENLRLIAKVMDLTHIWAALKDSNVKSLPDLAGKKVNIGPPGSGTQVNSLYILDALGLADKIKKQSLTFAGGANAMSDRQIDVTTGAGIPFTVPAITEASMLNPIRYIHTTAAEFQKIKSKYPFYALIKVPAGTVKGTDEAVDCVVYSAYWIVNDKVPDDVVYDMLKIIMNKENNAMLAKVQKNWSDVSGDFEAVANLGVPLKQGAAKFWSEQGVKIPQGLKVQ